MSFNCQTTTSEAKISIAESSPNPASATERASSAAMITKTEPTTFQPSVVYSSSSPLWIRLAESGWAAMTSFWRVIHKELINLIGELSTRTPGFRPGGRCTTVGFHDAGIKRFSGVPDRTTLALHT